MAIDELISKLNSDYEQISFTEDEVSSIQEYTGSSYELFSLASMAEAEKKNKLLISKRKLLEKIVRLPVSEAAYIPKSILEVFGSLIENSRTPRELVLYRGTSFKHFLATNVLNNDPQFNVIQQDSIYESLTYVSSSLDLDTALKFTSKHDPLIIEYHLPIFFPALWVEPISQQNEKEFILMRNQFFQIKSISSVDKDGKKIENGSNNYLCVEPVKRL